MESTDTLPPSRERRSVLDEFFELLLQCFRAPGEIKNEWALPFDPAPSSFPRKHARTSPPRRKRRPF